MFNFSSDFHRSCVNLTGSCTFLQSNKCYFSSILIRRGAPYGAAAVIVIGGMGVSTPIFAKEVSSTYKFSKKNLSTRFPCTKKEQVPPLPFRLPPRAGSRAGGGGWLPVQDFFQMSD